MNLKYIFIITLWLANGGSGIAEVRQEGTDNTQVSQQNFYQTDVVQSVHLTISQADQHRMMEALPECIYVPATFRWQGVELEKVAVRFKGNSSSQPNQTHKRSFLVRFDKYENNQRFIGLRRVSFDNGVQFGSLFSEPIITEILRAEGLPAYRCNYAKVYVNDEYRGVYVNVERIDESFLEKHFPKVQGGLWKNDVGGPGGDLRFVGDDPKRYEKAFEAKNKTARSREELLKFIRRINQTPDAEFATMLQSSMNVDDFLRVTSIMLLSGAFDQLTGWGPHNFYLFHHAQRDRWHYFPWDLDVGFCETAFGHVHVLDDWNAAWPVPVGRSNPLLDRIIEDPKLLSRYRTIAAEILEKHFQPEQICDVIDKKYHLIKLHLQADPFPKRRVTVPVDDGYEGIVESMKLFMQKRYATAQQQLRQPSQRPRSVEQARGNSQAIPVELLARIKRVEREAQGMQRKLQQLQQVMQRVRRLVQEGDFAEADNLLSEALKLSSGSESPSNR